MSLVPAKPVDPVSHYWNKTFRELVDVQHPPIHAEEGERHTMFSLLVMALVSDAFNGNKHGPNGTYPLRAKQAISAGLYRGDPWGDRYLGHNIACIAVDASGEIIDYEFNHNELFNSSAEHAEARLIRRIFNLAQSNNHWQTIDPAQIVDVSYSTVLSGVTLYTSLESCAQCSGIMTLGNVNRVIYLQSDPGQYRIGNIMFNLSNPLAISHPLTHTATSGSPPPKYGAPEPVGADRFGFAHKDALQTAYAQYVGDVANPSTPFWKSPAGKVDASDGITSFLCTDLAKDIFDAGAQELSAMTLRHPSFVMPHAPDPAPTPAKSRRAPPAPRTNADVLEDCRRFRIYAKNIGRRATPHR